jgi:hypothetical protein
MYAMAWAECFGCKRNFAFNPVKVPSIRIDGDRKPVCAICVARVNPMRVANGLEPIEVHPDAYTACDEREMGE